MNEAEKQAKVEAASGLLNQRVDALANRIQNAFGDTPPGTGSRRAEPMQSIGRDLDEVIARFTELQEAIGLPDGEEPKYSLFYDGL